MDISASALAVGPVYDASLIFLNVFRNPANMQGFVWMISMVISVLVNPDIVVSCVKLISMNAAVDRVIMGHALINPIALSACALTAGVACNVKRHYFPVH